MDFDPIPKKVNSPQEAISLAEAVLKSEIPEDQKEKNKIVWRKDEFYPNNFFDYCLDSLTQELLQNKSVVLQKVTIDGEFPILGDSIAIFTEEIEKKFVEEADTALDFNEESLEKKIVHIRGESPLIKRKRNSKN
jgi:hypothetical protein